MAPLTRRYNPKISYIKGVDNTVADAISRLEYDPQKKYIERDLLMLGGPAQKTIGLAFSPPFFLPNDKHETGDMPACKVDMPAREFKFHHFQFRNEKNQVLD